MAKETAATSLLIDPTTYHDDSRGIYNKYLTRLKVIPFPVTSKEHRAVFVVVVEWRV
jgi:hypothetical protein